MTYVFDLAIGWQQMQRYYQGQAQLVVVRCLQGRVIHLHPRFLRPFLTASGVRGRFQLTVDGAGQFSSLERIH